MNGPQTKLGVYMPSKQKWFERWEKEKSRRQPSRSVKVCKPEDNLLSIMAKMMPNILVKFCKPEHNLINGCPTIRFGTFEYYREMDPNFAIADENEAREATLVNSHVGEGSQEAIETLEEITGLGAGNHYISFYGITFVKTFPNCYIWCCSRSPKALVANQSLRFNEGYTSRYEITDAELWAKYLLNLLRDSIFRIPFKDSAREKLNEFSRQNKMNELHFLCVHRDVVYVDEKKSIIEHGEAFPYVSDIPRQLRPIFVKHKKYSLDSEYRFVFVVQHPKEGILEIQKDPFDVQISLDNLAVLPIAAL